MIIRFQKIAETTQLSFLMIHQYKKSHLLQAGFESLLKGYWYY